MRELAERVREEGVEATATRVNRVELGQTMPPLDFAEALFWSVGAPLDTIQEIIRSTKARKKVDVSDASFEELIEQGKQKRNLGLFRDAVSLFEAAHDILLLGDDDYPPDDMAMVLCLLADTCERLRLHRMSVDAAERALNLEGVSKDLRLRALLLHVEHGYMTGNFYQAGVFAERAQILLDDAPPELRAFARGVIGYLSFKQDDYSEAVAHLEEARVLYLDLGRVCQAAQVGVSLGYSFFRTGHPRSGRRIVSHSLADAQGGNYLEVAAFALRFLGRMDVAEGDPKRAAERFGDAATVARRLQLPAEEFMALHLLHEVQRDLGETRKAGRTRSRLKQLMRDVDPRLPERRAFLEQSTQTVWSPKRRRS